MLINALTLASSSRFQKWSGLYFLFIALALSGLINSVVQHIQFRDISISTISSIVVALLIVAGFVFVIRWLDINKFQVSLEAGYPLTSNGRQLGILLFGIGVFIGPAVTLYLIACYIAFAPLFVDNQGSVKFDSLSIAIAFGILISGLLYVLSADIGLAGELIVPIVLLGLAVFNLLKYKHKIIPRIAVSNYLSLAVLSTLFIAYGGTVLVGSVMMGIGDYPQVFFNVDSPLRLTHAHGIFRLTEYPPESLTTKGVFRAYHYGGPAAVATIAAITGLAVHKSMFFVALPILLIGSFSAICLLSRSVLQNSGYRYLSIMLFLPFVRFGEELYHRLIYSTQIYGVRVTLRRLVYEFVPFWNYNAEHFSEGIWDVSTTAGVFLLTLTAGLLVKRQLRQALIIAPVVVLLTFFTKIALIPAVSVLAGIKLLASSRAYRPGQIFWYILGSGGMIVLILNLFGTFDAVGNSVTARPIKDIMQLFAWQYLVDLYALTGGSALFFLLLYRFPARRQKTNGILLAVGGSVFVYACVVVFIVIDVWSAVSIVKATWIGIPLICMALMTVAGGSRYHKFVVNVVIAPICFIALIGQWHKIQQLAVTIIRPDMGHEYVLNHELAQALSTIPNEGRTLSSKSVIVTNNFQYSRIHQDHQYQITSLFGHQAYATDKFFIGQDATLKALAAQRVDLQQAQLSSLFNRSRPEFSANVISLAKQEGWTHYLFKKDDMGINLRSPSILYSDPGSKHRSTGDSSEFSRKALGSQDPYPIILRRDSGTEIDRVSCPPDGKVPDGFSDNTFVLDLLIPDDQVSRNPVITSVELVRENPPELYKTAMGGHVLGVSYDAHSPFLKKQRDRIDIAEQVEILITSSTTRLWLLFCADGHDTSNSQYFVRLTFASPIKIPEYDNADDIPLRKLFENNTYAVYEF